MSTTLEATHTYTKIQEDGSWGVRSHEEIKTNDWITITKKNGDERRERVGRIVWTNDEVWIATLKRSKRDEKPTSSSSDSN